MSDVYEAGRSYEADLLSQARRRTRDWQLIGGVSVITCIAFSIVAAVTVKQHTVTSHVVMVDRATGMAEVLSVTNMRDVPMQGIEAMAWARRYVEHRERYNHGVLQADYNSVIALSDDEIARVYDRQIRAKEAAQAARIEEHLEVLGVTLPPDQVGRAVVRFRKRVSQSGQPDTTSAPRAYIATLAFRFVPSPTGSRDTLTLNPLGFKVTAYVVEPELGAAR